MRIKAYASIIGLWAHLVNKHQDVDNEERLREVIHSATLWLEYWRDYSEGGKNNPTMAKLVQTQQEGFTWSDVLRWNLV